MALKPLIAGQFYNSGGGGGAGDMLKAVYDPANISAQLAGRTVANTFLAAQIVSLSSLGLTATPALTLINTTAAAAGAQQVSPSLLLQGQGWKTDATAGSQTVAFRMHVLPVQGSANPSGEWHLESSVNGAAFGEQISVTTGGTTTFGGSTVVAGGGSRTWAARGGISFPASGVLQFYTAGFASNVDLVATTSARLQLGQDAAGVTNQMITAANRITSDGVGANLTIAPGNGRGGAGGSLILSTYTTGGAGVAGTLTPRLYVNGPNGLLQFGAQDNTAPAIGRNGAGLWCRLADDSGYAAFDADTYLVAGASGVSVGPFTTITSITVVGGIVTDLQGS